MKKLVFAALTASLIAVANVKATTITIDRVSGYYYGNGGEFNISGVIGGGYAANVLVDNNAGQLGFETFCIELNEDVTIPGQYNAVINPYGDAVEGGVNNGAPGPDGGDPISLGTAYLYYEFATDGSSDANWSSEYNYTVGAAREASAASLQQAFWELENEVNLTAGQISGNVFLQDAIGVFGSLAAAEANNNGTYNVGVLNLTTLSGGLAQDQLVLLPDGGSTVMFLGLVMGGFALLRMRRVAS